MFSKTISMLISLAVVGSTLSVPTISYAQSATESDPLFAKNGCFSAPDQGGDCFYKLVVAVLTTAGETGILIGDKYLWDMTSDALKNTKTLRAINMEARSAVIKARNIVPAEKRAAMIDKIQNELAALKKAANEGKDVKVTTLVDETSTPVFDARVTRRIAELKQDLGELRAMDRSHLPANIHATIEKTINRDTESLARLESAEPVEHVIHGTTTVSTSTRTIYNAELKPAILKMETELKTWENLPIVTAEAKAEQVALAELAQKYAYQEIAATMFKRGLLRGAQLVEAAGAAFFVVDGGGRVLLYVAGYNPVMSPAIKIFAGKQKHYEIFGK